MKHFLSYSWLGFLVFSISGLYAQKPLNDSCSNAMRVTLGTANFGLGAYQSDSVAIDSADVEPGEWFHASQVSSGNDKKSVWFKFYLPTNRGVDIELWQTGSSIAIRDAGFTTYKTNSCLPGSIEAGNARITTLNQFGSSFHPCLETGWYMVQVSAKARATGKVYLKITTSYPYEHFGITNVQWDRCSQARDLGNTVIGRPGRQDASWDFVMGCYTLDDSSEYFHGLGSNYKDHNQSIWFKISAFNRSDHARFLFQYVNGNFSGKLAMRLYEGNCSGMRLIDSFASVWMSGSNCGGYGTELLGKDYRCTFDSGKVYYIQLLTHELVTGTLRLRIFDHTSQHPNKAYLPQKGIAQNLGVLKGSKNVLFGFACNGRIADQYCANNAMDTPWVRRAGGAFNMNQWAEFEINEKSNLTVYGGYYSSNSKNHGNVLMRLFRDSLTNDCRNMDTTNLVLEQFGAVGTANARALLCLDPGKYVVQFLGSDSAFNACGTPLHLGGDYYWNFTQTRLPDSSRFSLKYPRMADSVYAFGDTLRPLPANTTVQTKVDTVICDNTVIPELPCDNTRKKAIYRVFRMGDVNNDGVADTGLLQVYSAMSSAVPSRIYKGNALESARFKRQQCIRFW
jgi:hypothetical protein